MFLFGCKNSENNGIDLSTYFEDKVTYKVYNSTSVNSTLANFSHNKHDNLVQYTEIAFTGKQAWLYKMTLEKVSFDFYSNADIEDFELKITITNLTGAETSLTQSNTLSKTIPMSLTKNKNHHINLDVNDVFNSATASTSIKISVDSAYYKGDYAKLNFKFDISNFKVFGKHEQKNI